MKAPFALERLGPADTIVLLGLNARVVEWQTQGS